MPLRSQVNLLIALLMFAFVVALGALEIDAARRSIREKMEATNRVTVQLFVSAIENAQRDVRPALTRASFARFLQRLGRVRGNEITLYGPNRNLLYKSPLSRYQVGRAAPVWFTRLVVGETKPIILPVGDGVLEISPEPSRSVLEVWDELVRLFWLSLVFFAIADLLVFWCVARALHAVRGITDGLREIERGHFHARLQRFSSREMAAISDTFNRMAKAVEESFAAKQRAEQADHELQENRQLAQLIQRHVEDERRSLARELHDEVGQSVTAVRTIAAALVNRSRDNLPEIESAARMIVDVSGEMYDAMHRMVRRLRPLALDQLGLREALQELMEARRTRHPDLAFRTSIVRHACATRAEVRITRTGVGANDDLTIVVCDDGKGLQVDAVAREQRFGLLGVRERIEGLGGMFVVANRSYKGAVVKLTIPLGEVTGTRTK